MQKRRTTRNRAAITSQRPSIVIGVDPGASAGLAVVNVAHNPGLLFEKRCIVSVKGIDLTVSNFAELAIGATMGLPCIAVVEDQYVGVNMKTAITLSQRSGQWIEAFLSKGIPVERVSASSWQARELPGMKKREMLKKAARAKAAGIWGHDVGPDVADAALMARYRAIDIVYKGWHGSL